MSRYRIRGTIKVHLDRATLRALGVKYAAETSERGAKQAEMKARRYIIQGGRIRTGEMLRKVKAEPTVNPTTWRVTAAAEHSWYQEKGVRPFQASRGKVLRFQPKGSGVFIFRPRSKGFQGIHFMKKAVDGLTMQDFLP